MSACWPAFVLGNVQRWLQVFLARCCCSVPASLRDRLRLWRLLLRWFYFDTKVHKIWTWESTIEVYLIIFFRTMWLTCTPYSLFWPSLCFEGLMQGQGPEVIAEVTWKTCRSFCRIKGMLKLFESEVLEGRIKNCIRKFSVACNLESQAWDFPRGQNSMLISFQEKPSL